SGRNLVAYHLSPLRTRLGRGCPDSLPEVSLSAACCSMGTHLSLHRFSPAGGCRVDVWTERTPYSLADPPLQLCGGGVREWWPQFISQLQARRRGARGNRLRVEAVFPAGPRRGRGLSPVPTWPLVAVAI